jgi:hypothetical protein
MIAAPIHYRRTEFGLQTCSLIAWPETKSIPDPNGCEVILRPSIKLFQRKGTEGKMANRKGVFIGAYVPNQLKEALQQRAKAEHRTLSQEITRILEEAIRGRRLPPGFVDRRDETSGPRRRASDPLPRRRVNDVPPSTSDAPPGGDE